MRKYFYGRGAIGTTGIEIGNLYIGLDWEFGAHIAFGLIFQPWQVNIQVLWFDFYVGFSNLGYEPSEPE